MQPGIRQPVHDAYWRFAAERQRVFHKRASGETRPWTNDPIIASFKFCNVYRASDRVSQYLIRNVIYGPAADGLDPEDVFVRIVLFRLFSKITTWVEIERAAGILRRQSLRTDSLADLLDVVRSRQPIYTSAFILCASNPFGYQSKHRNHLALVREMFRPGRLGRQLVKARSLRQVYESLVDWPMVGPFMGYQLAIDLNYSEYFSFSEDDFTVPGPGAIRGLRKVFSDFGGFTPSLLIMRMVERQEHEFERLGLEWLDLFGRRLHAIDAQGLFCEIDKYSRIAFPNLKSNRTRIKHKFHPTAEPLDLFYPPKWQINKFIHRQSITSGYSRGVSAK